MAASHRRGSKNTKAMDMSKSLTERPHMHRVYSIVQVVPEQTYGHKVRRRWRIAIMCVMYANHCGTSIRNAAFLTKSEKAHVRSVFDCSGVRTLKETVPLLEQLGIVTRDDELRPLLQEVGHTDGAMLEFHQLLRIMQHFKRAHRERAAISDTQEVFRALGNGEGALPLNRIRDAAKSFGLNIDLDRVDFEAMNFSMSHRGANPKEKTLTYQQFVALLNAHAQKPRHGVNSNKTSAAPSKRPTIIPGLDPGLDVVPEDAISESGSMEYDTSMEGSESMSPTALDSPTINFTKSMSPAHREQPALKKKKTLQRQQTTQPRRGVEQQLLSVKEALGEIRGTDLPAIVSAPTVTKPRGKVSREPTDHSLNGAIMHRLFPSKPHKREPSIAEVINSIDNEKTFPFGWQDGRRAPKSTVNFSGNSPLHRVAQRERVNFTLVEEETSDPAPRRQSGAGGEHEGSDAAAAKVPSCAVHFGATAKERQEWAESIKPPKWKDPAITMLPKVAKSYRHVGPTEFKKLSALPSFALSPKQRHQMKIRARAEAEAAQSNQGFAIPGVKQMAADALLKLRAIDRARSQEQMELQRHSLSPTVVGAPTNALPELRAPDSAYLPSISNKRMVVSNQPVPRSQTDDALARAGYNRGAKVQMPPVVANPEWM